MSLSSSCTTLCRRPPYPRTRATWWAPRCATESVISIVAFAFSIARRASGGRPRERRRASAAAGCGRSAHRDRRAASPLFSAVSHGAPYGQREGSCAEKAIGTVR